MTNEQTQPGSIPTIFRKGYEKARATDPELADTYVAHTNIGDPAADAAVESLAGFDRRRAHQLIEAGVEQQESVFREAPRGLRDFFEMLASPPPDVRPDPELARAGSEGFYKDSDMFLLSLVGIGLVDNFATLIGRSFLMTGYTTQQSVRRLRQSLKQVMESMLPGGLERYGEGWKLTIRARLVHAQARRNLLQLDDWDSATYGLPVSAAHIGYATAAFSSLTLQGVLKLGVKPTRKQREGYMRLWRYIGWLVGVPDEILITDEASGLNLCRVGRICEPPPTVDSVIMAHTLVNSAALALGLKNDKKTRRSLADYGYRISRSLIGNTLADQLAFPSKRTFGLLTGMFWKRRIDMALGRISPTARAENFITLLKATELENPKIDYILPDQRHV